MLVAGSVFLGLALSAAPHLDQGLQALDALDYDRAATELQLAKQQTAMSRPDLLRLLEGQGRLEATLGHHDPAVAAFRELLTLDPTHAANANWAPKIRTPFFEAKSWQADHPALELKVEPGSGPLTLTLVADPLALVRTLRVHGAGAAAPIDSPVSGPGPLPVALPAGTTAFWAELVDGGGATLLVLGDEGHPIQRPLAESEALATGVSTAGDEGSSGLRYTGLAVGLAGGVGIIVGVVLGAQAQGDQNRFANAQRNAAGQITSLTRAQAISLDGESRTDATVADILFVAGGLAAATGVGLWIGGTFLSAAPEPKGAAVALAGSWP